MKNILITGATGFIGRNLIAYLETREGYTLFLYSRTTPDETLKEYIQNADYIIHLAGVSRPQDPKEFYEGNSGLTEKLVSILLEEGKSTPILYTSSIHAIIDNDFGKSKRLAEEHLLTYREKSGAPVYILRLTNTFGKWAKPNAHSVIATFCYNISHSLPIHISDPNKEITLIYIDDVVSSSMNLLMGQSDNESVETAPSYYTLTRRYTRTLSQIAEYIEQFKAKGILPEGYQGDPFIEKLYITFLSYLE